MQVNSDLFYKFVSYRRDTLSKLVEDVQDTLRKYFTTEAEVVVDINDWKVIEPSVGLTDTINDVEYNKFIEHRMSILTIKIDRLKECLNTHFPSTTMTINKDSYVYGKKQ